MPLGGHSVYVQRSPSRLPQRIVSSFRGQLHTNLKINLAGRNDIQRTRIKCIVVSSHRGTKRKYMCCICAINLEWGKGGHFLRTALSSPPVAASYK